MNLVIVQCPHCQGRMQVDPRFLTMDTVCPSCRGPLRPCNHVASASPTVEPLPIESDQFEFEEEPPAKSYSKRRSANGNKTGVIWLSALALILVPTIIFVAVVSAAHERAKEDAKKALQENIEIEKKYPRGTIASSNDLDTYEKNIEIQKRGRLPFVEFVMVANVFYLLLFIPYIMIVLITAFCLSQAAKG